MPGAHKFIDEGVKIEMSANSNLRTTELFLVRIWLRSGGRGSATPGATGWSGRVQRVVDGEAHEFHNWQGMVDLIVEMLSLDGGPEGPKPGPEEGHERSGATQSASD